MNNSMRRLTVAAAAAAAAVSAAAGPTSTPPPLLVYYSATHQDNAVFATAASIASLDSTYAYIDTDLFVISNATSPQPPGTVALSSYYNPTTKHHMTTTNATFAASVGFTQLMRVEGWVIPVGSQDDSMLPLEMWYGEARQDYFLVGTQDNKNNAIGAGYVMIFTDCYTPLQWTVWPDVPAPLNPFPQSADLVGYEFAFGSQADPPGIGADTWYPSWDADGQLYSSFTDGTVDGVTSSSWAGVNATTGFVTITGDTPWTLNLSGVATFHESALPYEGRYPSVSFMKDGCWYYGTYSLENYQPGVNPGPNCGNWCVQAPFDGFRTSFDKGQTWNAPRQHMANATDNIFGETAFNNVKVKFGAPHAVDHGMNNVYSPQDRLYIVGHGAETPESHQSWMQGDSVYMARTIDKPDPVRINDPAYWEFYAGGHGDNATWTPFIASAKPLFVWMNRTGVVNMGYHATLDKYIMVVSTPSPAVAPSCVSTFDTYFLESDSITGPWAMVTYMPSYGPEAYFVHIPTKFMGMAAYPATPLNRATREAVPAGPLAAANAATVSAADASPLEAAALAWSAHEANLTALTRELAAPAGGRQAASYYSYFLSYSANFASGGSSANPPGSGYHWSLQPSRFGLSAEFAAKLEARKAAAAAAAMA